MTHTDKHWIIDPFDFRSVVDISDKAHHFEIFNGGPANAQLIAAAPDMLRLLYKVEEVITCNLDIDQLKKEIESAINKAEGNPLQVINLTPDK